MPRARPDRIAASVPLAIGEGEEAASQIAAAWLLAYLTRMGPLYPRVLREQFGYADAVEALLRPTRRRVAPAARGCGGDWLGT